MIIVKIGGGERLNLNAIITDLSALDESFMIVHGANALRDDVARKMGLEKQVITSASGFSSVFSDQSAVDTILMSYSGLRNKRLVELCQQNGINAVGLTGLDGRIVQGERNKGIRVIENGKKMIKRDLSGKPRCINTQLLTLLIENGYIPVLTIPISDENGFAINSENDDVVAKLQETLNAEIIIQLIEAEGFMENFDDPTSLIKSLSVEELAQRVDSADGRIKRKLYALNKVVKSGDCKVIICDGRTENPIRDGLAGSGTLIG